MVSLRSIIGSGLLVLSSLGFIGCSGRVAPNDRKVVFGDVNGDGLQDLVYSTLTKEDDEDNRYYDWDLFLSLKDLEGKFSEVQKIGRVGMPPNDLQLIDLNGDGNLDLSYLVMKKEEVGKDKRYYNWGLMVMEGNGDGTFKPSKEIYNFENPPSSH